MEKRRIVTLGFFIVLVVALGLAAFFVIASHRLNALASMSFDDMLRYTTKDNEDAIITVGVVRDGRASFTVYGENGTVLPSHEFDYEVGSVTKTFTASLLCKAVYEGKLLLLDSIDQYITLSPKSYYPNFLRLVTHTSGYKSHYLDRQMVTNFLRREKNDFYGISSEALTSKMGKVPVKDQDYPFKYSNFGFAVIGSALAEAYGIDFRTLMNDFVRFDLGLENTYISNGVGNLKGYWKWDRDDGYLPAGAIISTISDLLTYVQLHLSGELPYLALGHEVLAPVSATTKQYEKMGIRIDAIGVGWMIDTEDSIIWHNGGTSNFNSYIAFDKERQLGVVVLSNLTPNYRIPATVMGAKLIKTLQNEP